MRFVVLHALNTVENIFFILQVREYKVPMAVVSSHGVFCNVPTRTRNDRPNNAQVFRYGAQVTREHLP